jgi:predicted lipid-binding transport protein (Tim44 family)
VRRILAFAIAAAAVGALLTADLADARRLGGGRSFGAQRSVPQATTPAPVPPSVAPSTPGAASNPVMPAQPGAGMARPGAVGGAAAPAASGMSRWLAPVAGLAAGLGLAALLSHFGLSEAFGSFLLIALLVVGGVFLLKLLVGRRAAGSRPLQYAGPTNAGTVAKGYETDAPRGAGDGRFEPVFSNAGPVAAPAARPYPPGFDPEPFLAQARTQFARLQAAHDRGDRSALAEVMTPELYAEIAQDLDAGRNTGPTEILSLHAAIEEVVTENDRHWASVRFSGLLREGGQAQPAPFDERWNLVKPVDGKSGWLLAGIQQLEPAA